MNSPIRRIKIALLISGLMLCLALWPLWPAGFFTLLRWVVCSTCFYSAIYFRQDPQLAKFFMPLAFLGIMFNPVMPINLDLSLSLLLNFGTAICFLTLAKKIKIT